MRLRRGPCSIGISVATTRRGGPIAAASLSSTPIGSARPRRERRRIARSIELEIDARQVGDVAELERAGQHVDAIVGPEHVERVGREHRRARREIDRVLVADGDRGVRARGPEHVDAGRAEEQREDALGQLAHADQHVAARARLIVERARRARREQARLGLDAVAPQVADDAVGRGRARPRGTSSPRSSASRCSPPGSLRIDSRNSRRANGRSPSRM